MRGRRCISRSWLRGLAVACIAALGLVAIVGSGGGSDDVCNLYSGKILPESCFGEGPVGLPTAYIDPPRITVQVGGTAVFTVRSTGVSDPIYQWQVLRADGSIVNFPGATGATFALAGAQLADDGARILVSVGGQITTLSVSQLAVSSGPGVVLQDSEFLLADWAVAATADPTQGGPTHSEEREATGGNPGAFRNLMHAMSVAPSELHVFHRYQSADYDPATQGAIYVIDIALDCIHLSASNRYPATALLIEQDGRRYIAAATGCGLSTWHARRDGASMGVADFTQIDGPSCAAGESCPDFSSNGKPVRLGFTARTVVPAGSVAEPVAFGVDNWKVTVWRR